MKLDRTDARILRALQANARLSFRSLSQTVGVSVPTVSARVARLEEMGILSGYHASVDPNRLGQVRIVLVLRCRSEDADAVGAALAAKPEVRWTVRARGARIVAEAVVLRSQAVEPFLKWVRTLPGVLDYEHYVATKRYKDLPRAVVREGLAVELACYECGINIEGEPIRLKLDGRDHYLCCPSCETLYLDRYARIKAGSRVRGPR